MRAGGDATVFFEIGNTSLGKTRAPEVASAEWEVALSWWSFNRGWLIESYFASGGTSTGKGIMNHGFTTGEEEWF